MPPRLVAAQPQLYGSLTDAQNQHRHPGELSSLNDRLESAVQVLVRRRDAAKQRHSDAVVQWQALPEDEQARTPVPQLEADPVATLFADFNAVCPSVRLSVVEESLFAQKGDRYPVDQLSDGEKQAFALLADVSAVHQPGLFVVDEPELNLHPKLANDLWDRLEQRYPDALFLYATHALTFALRPSVDAMFILREGEQAVEVDLRERTPLDEHLHEFLGALPGIIRSSRVLFVEGHDASFDRDFYGWLLGDGVAIVSRGPSTAVVSAVRGRALWQHAVPRPTVVGVVDRDVRSPAEVAKLTEEGCVVLALREAESYLCDPTLMQSISRQMGREIAASEVESLVRDAVRKAELRTAAELTAATARVRVGVEISSEYWEAERNEAEVRGKLSDAQVSGERQFRDGVARAGEIFEGHLAQIRRAVEAPDIAEALRFVGGKTLLRALARKIGAGTEIDLMRMVRGSSVDPSESPHTASLREALRQQLGLV